MANLIICGKALKYAIKYISLFWKQKLIFGSYPERGFFITINICFEPRVLEYKQAALLT